MMTVSKTMSNIEDVYRDVPTRATNDGDVRRIIIFCGEANQPITLVEIMFGIAENNGLREETWPVLMRTAVVTGVFVKTFAARPFASMLRICLAVEPVMTKPITR
jgi:hypothetical protein